VSVQIPNRQTTTTLLTSATHAGADALDRLVPFIYDELRQLARRQLAREVGAVTIHTTELVHEAYLRLVDDTRVANRGRAYFFGAAARAMRRILIEAARRRGATKRGGGEAPLTLEESHVAVNSYATELLELDRALETLQSMNPRQVRVVECRFFAGLSVEETAAALDISPRTVKSDWSFARAWLFSALHPDEETT
jgi:RNA polymerase sigma factor (TIGR02999 family)